MHEDFFKLRDVAPQSEISMPEVAGSWVYANGSITLCLSCSALPQALPLASVRDRRWGQHNLLSDPMWLIVYSLRCKCP